MLHIIEEPCAKQQCVLFNEHNSRKLLNETGANRMHIGNSALSRSAGGEKHER